MTSRNPWTWILLLALWAPAVLTGCEKETPEARRGTIEGRMRECREKCAPYRATVPTEGMLGHGSSECACIDAPAACPPPVVAVPL
jgi:hypothetical protein